MRTPLPLPLRLPHLPFALPHRCRGLQALPNGLLTALLELLGRTVVTAKPDVIICDVLTFVGACDRIM